jgi:hypothetical protein
MAGVTHSSLRRGLAALVLGAAIAAWAAMVVGTQHASAQAVPNKSCTGPTSSGAAKPGDTLVCTITAVGLLFDGDSFTVTPNAPTGSFIPAKGCTGASGGAGPLTYTTAETDTGLGSAAGACKFVVSTTNKLGTAANDVIGYELLTVPATTPAGTSVTQQVQVCGPPPPIGAIGSQVCLPFGPLPTSGPGSCIGGAVLPVLGGCIPANPASTPTTTPSQSQSSSSGGTTTTDNGGSSAGGVQAAAAKSTPFTSGPPHPLPVAATLVAVGGALLALVGLGTPMLLRRRRGR